MIFDTHAHYDDEAFASDRDDLLRKFKDNEIVGCVDIASTMESNEECLSLAHRYPFLYCALGVHPSECANMTDDFLDKIEKMAADPKVVAIGEIGLDYHYPDPSHELQEEWFRKQLRLAARLNKPVVIHSREAAADTLTIMEEEQAWQVGGVIHCYSYSEEMAKIYLKKGFYLGIGGVLTFPSAKKLKAVVAMAPLEQLVLETDCPYLSPVPHRGERNSSLNLKYVVEEIARLKDIPVETVLTQTYANAQKLYQLS